MGNRVAEVDVQVDPVVPIRVPFLKAEITSVMDVSCGRWECVSPAAQSPPAVAPSAVLIDLSLPECVAGLSPKFIETVLPEVNERCYTKLSAVDAWQLARLGNMRRTG